MKGARLKFELKPVAIPMLVAVLCLGSALAAKASNEFRPTREVPAAVRALYENAYVIQGKVITARPGACYSGSQFTGIGGWQKLDDPITEADKLNGVTKRSHYALQARLYRPSASADWAANDLAAPTSNSVVFEAMQETRHGKTAVKVAMFCL
jgi:hypothetical protein